MSSSGDKPIALFYTILAILMAVNIVSPYLDEIFYERTVPNTINFQLDEVSTESSGVNIVTSILTIPFWTISLPVFLNLPFLILRIILWITAYYIIFPTK